MRRYVLGAAVVFAGALTACTSEGVGRGDLTVLVEAEDLIVDGLEPGDGSEDIRDGWRVRFDSYVAVIGDIDLHLASDPSVEAQAHELFAVDLTSVPSGGLELWEFVDLDAGRWEFNYTTSGAADGAQRHPSVSEEDFAQMQAGDWTYLVEGSLVSDDGRSCPPRSHAQPPAGAVEIGMNSAGDVCYPATSLAFRFGAEAQTLYGPCEVDGTPGTTVPAGGTKTVAATIHGDHLFFNGFPEGAETVVLRLAQWLADSDLDLDGEVTRQELESLAPADLPEIDGRYQLGGSPITPLATMWDYVRAQLKTQGHFQGEGECPADGVGHNHG